jgi:hypothetical protein
MAFVFSACGAESFLGGGGGGSSSPKLTTVVVSPETPPVTTTYLNDPLRTAVEIVKVGVLAFSIQWPLSLSLSRFSPPVCSPVQCIAFGFHVLHEYEWMWLLMCLWELHLHCVWISCLASTHTHAETQHSHLAATQDRLYYVAVNETPSRTATRNGKPIHYFQVDTELIYWNFFLDFGPLNLGQLYRFSTKLNSFLNDRDKKNHIIVFYSSSDPKKRANAIYLITAWQMLYLNRTPEEAILGFPKQHHSLDSNSSGAFDAIRLTSTTTSTMNTNSRTASSPPLAAATFTTLSVPPFHDASPFSCNYDLTILDCLRGLLKARNYGFFDFSNFDVDEYEHFEQVEVRNQVYFVGCGEGKRGMRDHEILIYKILVFRMGI